MRSNFKGPHRLSRNRPEWQRISGGVAAARGFLASGVAAEIKKQGLDLAVVFSSRPSVACGVFTTNLVKAAPVLLSKKHLSRARGRIRAVLLNSGCANACTGRRGMAGAVRSARCLASHLGIDPYQVVVASTGVIGIALPIQKLLKGIPAAVAALSPDGWETAARAIMTTDTREKTCAVEGRIGDRPVRIGGMAKGAGMIHPQMATMLSVITTDAAIPRPVLESVFRRVVERTFNCLTVDGDTSTNDMVLLIANGASDAKVEGAGSAYFEQGLEIVCEEMAKMVARDGEGATKFVEVLVDGASSVDQGRRVAKAIAHSPLVKTALYGQELNWGRIVAAAGCSGVRFNPDRVVLRLCGIPVFRNGMAVSSTQRRAEEALAAHDLQIHLDLAQGRASARIWTCDLSHGYIDINGSYVS